MPDAAAIGTAGETGTVEIQTSVAGATIEVVGAGTGPAPFRATLEKGKKYKVLVTAETYQPVEIEVQLGDRVPVVTLTPLPRVVKVTSEPGGAMILFDGENTGKRTPADVALSARQIARDVRLSLRRAGYAPFNKVIAPVEFAGEGSQMVAAVHAGMVAAKTGDGRAGDGSRSATGARSGAKGTATATGDEKGAAPPKEPEPDWATGSETPAPKTGTSEPTPAWMKP
jgi:hypothetical protein